MAETQTWHWFVSPGRGQVAAPAYQVPCTGDRTLGWIFDPVQWTPEQQQVFREQQEKERLERVRAENKARELFLSKLTAHQRKSFQAQNGFFVRGSEENQYWISCSSTTENVYLMKLGHAVAGLCAGPPGVPSYDFWLSQKLLLEADEEAFRAVAVMSTY